jgi:DNA-binding MarR family transcriptional regulator
MAAGESTLDRLGQAEQQASALEDREVAVLRELGVDSETRVAFQGLRRRLELHQEALSRTLRRLERDGLVDRGQGGYRLTEQGFAALRGAPQGPARETLTVVQAVLPPNVGPGGVLQHLGRRWFRGLRWYGQAEAPDETTLTWLAEPGNAKVRVRVAGGTLTLEVEVMPGDAPRSLGAARGVLAALAELYGLGEEPGPAGAFGASAGFAA